MGTRPSVFAVYGKDERGIHTFLRHEYSGPTNTQKEAGYTPKPVSEKKKEAKREEPKKSGTKTKSKKKSKKR